MPETEVNCYHCGLTVPKNTDYSVTINGDQQPMCCAGCEAVAEAIVQHGLTNFYQHRTTHSDKPEDLIPADLHIYDNEDIQQRFVRMEQGGTVREASLILEGIVCAACVWLNEKYINQLAGVIDFRVNYTTHRAQLSWDNQQISLSEILQAISAIGYHAHPFDANRLENLQQKEKAVALRRIAIAGVGMMQVMMIAISLYIGEASDMQATTETLLRWISLILTTPVVLFASSGFFIAAWRDLRRKRLGMDVPVSIAILGAYLASCWATVTGTGEVYFDSVNMFTFFLLVGRYLEMSARHQAGKVAEELIRLLPDSATLINQHGQQETVVVNELALGDTLLIKAGEIIPADGYVVAGQSCVNEALLTGESLPVPKTKGSELIGGTINSDSPLQMKVDKLGENTVLSAIVRLLDQAQAEKPRLHYLADKISAWFVLAILLIASAVFTFWSWQTTPTEAFWITLSVLVVTCPCALSLATPVALTAATGHLTEKGVLTTSGHALETLANVNHVVFDKTGTLTHGELVVTQVQTAEQVSVEWCQNLAVAFEAQSEHPVAKAIQQLPHQRLAIDAVDDLTSVAGKGLEGRFDGDYYRIGTYAFVTEWLFTLPEPPSIPKQWQCHNGTESLVFLVSRHQWLACFTLGDKVREESVNVVDMLHKQGVSTTLLSGDNKQVVTLLAQELHIKQAHSQLLPQDKLDELTKIQQNGDIVVMVGDGVNDAPVLAKADVSMAMGKGAQLAQASADMVLLAEDLSRLPEALLIARKMMRIIKQNLSWAIGYNLLAIPLAASGLIAPWMAAIGMSASSLVVVLNALRLQRYNFS